MKASDYIAKRLKEFTSTVFGVTGGAVVNLFDSIHKHGPRLVPMHHEQAAAMAADAYARVSGRLGVCIGTSGPGGNNLLTGLGCSYYDSVPVLALVGQVPSTQLCDPRLRIRQVGFQECPNAEILESFCKTNGVRVIEYGAAAPSALEHLVARAMTPRCGPTLMEICDDAQREETTANPDPVGPDMPPPIPPADLKDIANAMSTALRPLLIVGAGVNTPNGRKALEEFLKVNNIPTFLTWGAMDMLDNYHILNMRDFGVTSQRIGNYAMQHADVILCLGTRLDTHEVGDYETFAPKAKVIVVDIDKEELKKRRYFIAAHGDAEDIFNQKFNLDDEAIGRWVRAIADLRADYSIVQNPFMGSQTDLLNPYLVMDILSGVAPNNATIIADAGQTVTWTMQGWKVKKGQRLFSAFNHSPMGYAVPASIGAYYAARERPIYAITGDGGLMMNLQELQTISARNLPVKVIVLDNAGYGMIRQTQSDWRELENDVCCSAKDGVSFPDYSKLADAFGLLYVEARSYSDLVNGLVPGTSPMLIRVVLDPKSKIEPKLKAGQTFENQHPLLPTTEQAAIHAALETH